MLFLAPTAFAQVFSKAAKNPAVNSIVTGIMRAIVIPIVEGFFVFTFLVFLWGVFGLIRGGGDATARKEGQNHMLWGIVGMAIMVSAYGLIRLIGSTVGVGDPFE